MKVSTTSGAIYSALPTYKTKEKLVESRLNVVDPIDPLPALNLRVLTTAAYSMVHYDQNWTELPKPNQNHKFLLESTRCDQRIRCSRVSNHDERFLHTDEHFSDAVSDTPKVQTGKLLQFPTFVMKEFQSVREIADYVTRFAFREQIPRLNSVEQRSSFDFLEHQIESAMIYAMRWFIISNNEMWSSRAVGKRSLNVYGSSIKIYSRFILPTGKYIVRASRKLSSTRLIRSIRLKISQITVNNVTCTRPQQLSATAQYSTSPFSLPNWQVDTRRTHDFTFERLTVEQ